MQRSLTPQPPSHAQQPLTSSSMPDLRAFPDETSPAIPSSSKTFKFKLPWKRDEDGILQMRESVVQTIGVLEKVTKLAANASSNASVPGLSAGLYSVTEVLRRLQMVSTTIKGVDTLKTRVEDLSGRLNDYDQLPRDQPMPEAMRSRLEALVRKWAEAGISAQGLKERNWFKRLWRSDADAAELEGLVDRINTSIFEFMLQGGLVVEENVLRIRGDVAAMQRHADEMAGEITEMWKAAKVNLDASFLPGYAKKAQFDANDVRHGCLENTRVDLLNRLHQWITRPTGDVLWINGPAGTGKTTVAYSIASSSKKQDILAASFFCSRADAECSDAERIIPTIVRQLCRYHAPYREVVEAVLQQDPDVVHLKLESQFEKLVVIPLEALKRPFPRAVVVIDALDECRDKSAASTILEVLAKFISRIKDYLLFLITSRPEPHITTMFSKVREDSLANATTLLLHEEELNSVLEDIRRYFIYSFRKASGTFAFDKGWPSTRDIDTLVDMSHGLFIWAATVVRFIFESVFGDPPEQMQSVIDKQGPVTLSTGLNSLYDQITRAVSSKIPATFKDRFQLILGTIAVAQEPLSTSTLARLLGIPSSNTVYNLLLGMHSVLHVPDNPNEPVRVIHPTFPEYLIESSLEKPDAFRGDAPTLHRTLFSRCLVVMSQLEYNLCGIGDPLRFKAEVSPQEEGVKRYIPMHLYYACRHWGGHLQDAMGSPDATELGETAGSFCEFLHRDFLNWLEACSLIAALDTAITALERACDVFKALGEPFAELVLVVIDCHRFLLTFVKCIDEAPLQAHHSVLALTPSLSCVKKIYGAELRDSVAVRSGGMQDWGHCLDVFQGDAGYPVYCIAFSSDGACFATGGGDYHIEIRRRMTRTLLLSIGGHLGDVTAVTFSPDSCHVASGSDDKTVGVWRVTSGGRVHTLEGHTGAIYSVGYSKDGRRILSASHNEVILWDSSSGRCLLTLPTTPAETWQVGLSPDAGAIAHRDDSGLCLYNVASTTGHTLALPSPAHAAAFSPDGKYVAAASEASICIWTAADLAVVRSIDVPAFPFRLAFSHDGTRIACGLKDGTVCVWQVQSGDPPHVFRGHTYWVLDVTWSPDNAQIASASNDSNVRIWDPTRKPDSDVQRRPHEPTFPSPDPHPSTLLYLGDSIDIIHIPNPSVIKNLQTSGVTPSLSLHSNIPDAWEVAQCGTGPDHSLEMSWCMLSRDWGLLTGQPHIQTGWRPVAVSQDFSLMAYLPGGVNTEVHIRSLRTGAVVAELAGHTGNIRSASFSSDGALLVTGSNDKIVRVWNVAAAALVFSHAEHTEWILATTFSLDNQLIVSGSRDGTARVYNIATSCITHVFEHQNGVVKVAFSIDNKYLLTLDAHRHVSIWDLPQSACIYQVSLAESSWPQSLDFTPDGSGLLIRNLDGQALTSFIMHRPFERTWPMYHVSKDGWVTAVSPGKARRVCWLLPEWRAVFSLGGPRFCALDFDRKMSVMFDVSQTKAYAETWGVSS